MYTLLLNGAVIMRFAKAKKYDVGTGYVALFEEKEKSCVLCRYLEAADDLLSNSVYLLRECSSQPLTAGAAKSAGKPVVILSSNVGSVDAADKLIESYKKALSTLPIIETGEPL